MKQILLLLGFLILISCNSNKTGKNEIIQQPVDKVDSILSEKHQRFIEFKKRLPKYNLPIEIHCGFDSMVSLTDYKDFRDFIPTKMEEIYGYVNTNQTSDLILFGRVGDDLYPYIYSFDNNGNILDSLFLIINPCGQADEFYIPNSFAFIDNNGQISMIDTSLYIHYIDNMNYKIDSTIITMIEMKVDKNGKFKEIKKEIKQITVANI
ncbi:hypothetical protein ACT3CD_16625 [Geofilum sp. OHC36d9]|uniref:hypothetical protein n=1 Tax=Geofilum sp. OHC36d9 TaxID=3458413 RepID=UPI004034A9E0